MMLTCFLGLVLGAAAPQDPQFHPPVRLTAEGAPIVAEDPGYACPTWHDIDGDQRADLIVGQFRDGKMRVHKNLGGGKFGKGEWLLAEGDIAQVPGVW